MAKGLQGLDKAQLLFRRHAGEDLGFLGDAWQFLIGHIFESTAFQNVDIFIIA